MPFDCWSLLDYGFHEGGNDTASLSLINDMDKAQALLALLGGTIGTSESAVIPRDLPDALDRIRHVAEPLVTTEIFRRLATAARRLS